MKFLWIACGVMIVVFVSMIIINRYFSLYVDKYKLNFYFGLKGSGKSTLIAKLALRALKKGRNVYCNYSLNIPGTRQFNMADFGKFKFPGDSEVFIDEGGTIFDNRDFKTFSKDSRDYFVFQRKRRNVIHLFSQAWNVDLKIRQLCDNLFMVEKHMYLFSVARRIKKRFKVVEASADAESRIADELELEPFWLALLGFRVAYFTWIPKYTKYFNSFEAPELEEIPYVENGKITTEDQTETLHPDDGDVDPRQED